MNTRKLLPHILGLLQSEGFRQHSNHFFRRKGDVLYVLSFFSPPGHLYCRYCIMPLYMPFDCITYTYGKRMKTVLRTEDPEAIEAWKADFEAEYWQVVKPWFAWAEKRMERGVFFHSYKAWGCMNYHLAKLEAYTAVYGGSRWYAKAALSRYQRQIDRCTLFAAWILERDRQEVETFRQLMKAGPAEISHYFSGIIRENEQRFKLKEQKTEEMP